MHESLRDNLDFFPYGTQYHRAPTPLPEEWDTDLEELAKQGYTHVQFRPQWRWHERVKGHTTWDDLDTLFELAHKHGLRVVLKPMLETAPDWAFQELGGTRIGFHGVPISPIGHGAFYVGGWQPCFDNPEVMGAALGFVREMTQRYKDHPALWFYNAWNEPSSGPMGDCHCEHSRKSYQEWLREKYGSIEALNHEFGKAWTSFETVTPPESGLCFADMYLWRQWAMWATSRHVKDVTDCIKSVDPNAFVMCHAGVCSALTDIAHNSTDDILNSQVVDRYGTSWIATQYPSVPVEYYASDYVGDWLRRVDSQFLVHEFYPQFGMGFWNKSPKQEHLNMLIWMAIASGTSGFTFWQYRAERLGCEINLAGLREIDGSPSSRSEVADGIASTLREHGKMLSRSKRPKSNRAQLYCIKSDLISRVQSLELFGKSITEEKISWEYPYKKSARMTHILYGRGASSLDMVIPGDDLSGVNLLIVSCAEIIEAETAQWLEDYVKRGGNLIVEFPFACRTANTWISPKRPTHSLSSLLGCRESERVQTQCAIYGMYDECMVRFENGVELSAKGERISLAPECGQAIAWWDDGAPAAVKHKYFAGNVISLGVSLSLSAGEMCDDPVYDITDYLLSVLGIDIPDSPQDVIIRKRATEDREIWFVFNISDEERTVSLPSEHVCTWAGAESCSLANRKLILSPQGTWVGESKI
ncbi:MAG: beta-galactosidase [Armatimonadota bacterium]